MAVDGIRRIDAIGVESRRRILDAAEILFAEKGFDRTSFVEIAERSGISRGSIPWHFKNKDGLLMAVVERQTGRNLPKDFSAESVPTFREMIEQLVKLIKGPAPNLFYMVLTEAMTTEGVVHDQYVAYFRELRSRVVDWVLASHPNLSSSQAEALAIVINAATLGIQLQWRLDPDGVDLELSLDSLAVLVEAVTGLPDDKPAPKGRKRPSAQSPQK